MAWLAIVVIVLSSLVLGWLIILQFQPANWRIVGSGWEPVMAAFVLGTAVIGYAAFILAEFGQFSVWSVGGIWLLLVLALGFRWRRLPRTNGLVEESQAVQPGAPFLFLPPWAEYAALAIWLPLVIWLFFRPHQYVLGAADAGVYVNLAANIARNGRILVNETLLPQMSDALAPIFLRYLGENGAASYYLLPGFYTYGLADIQLTPQFYHLHPVWQAVAFGLAGSTSAGAQAALMMPGLWAVVGALMVYGTVRQFAGWQVALGALAGLTINALQVWFARYPTTEAFGQFLLWAGLWGTGAWLARRKPVSLWALLGGVSLGGFFLVRIDAVMIAPVLVLLGLWLWLFTEQRPPGSGWFFGPVVVMFGHSLAHGYWQSRPYFMDLYGLGFRILRNYGVLVAWGAAAALVVLVLLAYNRRHLARILRFQRALVMLTIVAALLFAVYGWLVRPYTVPTTFWNDPYSGAPIPVLNHENWLRLGWYLSPLGIGLGVAGICWLLWRVQRKTVVMLGITLLLSAAFLWNIRANPHQVYAMRRYVMATVPLFSVGAAAVIGALLANRRRWAQGVGAFAALFWLGGLLWLSRGFVTQVDYAGIVLQLQQLNQQLEPNAILLFNDQSPIGQGDLVGTPLRFLFGHDVLTVRQIDKPQLGLLLDEIGEWQENGRSVYWINVPTSQTEWLPRDQMQRQASYQLQGASLENSYDHRPAAIVTPVWSGDIYRLLPVERGE